MGRSEIRLQKSGGISFFRSSGPENHVNTNQIIEYFLRVYYLKTDNFIGFYPTGIHICSIQSIKGSMCGSLGCGGHYGSLWDGVRIWVSRQHRKTIGVCLAKGRVAHGVHILFHEDRYVLTQLEQRLPRPVVLVVMFPSHEQLHLAVVDQPVVERLDVELLPVVLRADDVFFIWYEVAPGDAAHRVVLRSGCKNQGV